MHSLRKRCEGDDGVILVFALIFLGVIALVVSSVIGFSTTGVRSVAVSRGDLAKRYAADATLKYALQEVRVASEACDPTTKPLNGPLPLLLTSTGAPYNVHTDAPDVEVTCTLTAEPSTYGAAGYAVVTRDTSALGFRVAGANNDPTVLPVEGPVFIGARAASGALDLPLDITNGNAYGYDGGPGCPVRPTGLKLETGFTYQCLTTKPDPDITLPTVTLEDRDGTPFKTIPDLGETCAVFLPGRYTSLQLTDPATKKAYDNVYLASGIYSFRDVDVEIGLGQTVFGGRPLDADEVVLDGEEACASDSDAFLDADVTKDYGTGVKIVLEGTSRLAANGGKIALYSREAVDGRAGEGTQGVSLMTVTDGESSTWKRSCRVALVAGACSSDNKDLVLGAGAINSSETCDNSNVGGGQQTSFVVFGLIYAPDACVRLRSQSTEIQLLGGIVAGRLHIGASANIGGFNIRVTETAGPRTMKITATACFKRGASSSCEALNTAGDDRLIKATAVLRVDHATGEVEIQRWETPL